MKRIALILIVVCCGLFYLLEKEIHKLRAENYRLKQQYETVKFRFDLTEMHLDRYQNAFGNIEKKYPHIADEFDWMINVNPLENGSETRR